jgi:hypothetical protein
VENACAFCFRVERGGWVLERLGCGLRVAWTSTGALKVDVLYSTFGYC